MKKATKTLMAAALAVSMTVASFTPATVYADDAVTEMTFDNGATFSTLKQLGVSQSTVYMYLPEITEDPSYMITPVIYVYSDHGYDDLESAYEALADLGLQDIADENEAVIFIMNPNKFGRWTKEDMSVYYGVLNYTYWRSDELHGDDAVKLTANRLEYVIAEGDGATFVNEYMSQACNRIAAIATFGGEMPEVEEYAALPAYIVGGTEEAISYYKSVNEVTVTETAESGEVSYNEERTAQKVIVSDSDATSFDKELIADAWENLFSRTYRQAVRTSVSLDQFTDEIFTLCDTVDVEEAELTFTKVTDTGVADQEYWYEWVPNEVFESTDETYPVVLCLHGMFDHPYVTAETNGWIKVAAEERVIVVSPENTTGSDTRASIMDVLDAIIEKYPVDTSRIYVAGFSAGAGAASYLANNYTEVFAAMGLMSPASGASYDTETVLPTFFLAGGQERDAATDGQLKSSNLEGINRILTANGLDIIEDYDFETYPFFGFEREDTYTITTKDGFNMSIGTLSNEDGIPLMELVCSEDADHCNYEENAKLAYAYMSQFSRDTETGEVIYTPAE